MTTYPGDLEIRLGFDHIRDRLVRYCLGELGRKGVAAISFQTSPDAIRTLLETAYETKLLLDSGEDFPIHSYDDPSPWYQVAGVEGSYLEAVDLSKLAAALLMIQEASTYLTKDPNAHPRLSQLALPKAFGKRIVNVLLEKVDGDGRINDSASADLARIRHRLREEELRARRIADQIMRKALDEGWCAESSNPTIRDGRLVVPLMAEHKRKIKGYLIDQSATGQTVFVEPSEIMEANNDLRELELDERKEIIRILKELTQFVHRNNEEIQSGYTLLGLLDVHRAKAKVACDLQAGLPALVPVPALRWFSVRHPLLYLAFKNKRPLIPLTIELSEENRFLLVSGPNAGGKSVCLKTVGLIQYMVQCGLLVPMDEDSEAGVFDAILLDIGDQQSLESDLSTYSSHLKNMDYFIRHGSSGALVLMDELGSGTDPNFGGGIAQAILEQLLEKKVWGLATTHYYNLKVFASQFGGIRNASMQFDTEKLLPLYVLEIGQPGSSFAVEIARKIGLSEQTLQAAERIIGSKLIGLETLMKQVAEEKQRLAQMDEQLVNREKKLATTRQEYEELLASLNAQKKEILNSAKMEASTLLQETNREIEKTIRHIRENKAEKQETRKVRQGLLELEKKVIPQSSPPLKPADHLKVGDNVRMMGGEVTGKVLAVKGTKATVQFGDLRSAVKVERLVRSDRTVLDNPVDSTSSSSNYSRGQSDFSALLDVRGMRVEVVIPLLTRFMDDALQFGLRDVRILHGKGEGILRKVVREYLKKTKGVESFADEHADRGGDGITLVILK